MRSQLELREMAAAYQPPEGEPHAPVHCGVEAALLWAAGDITVDDLHNIVEDAWRDANTDDWMAAQL